ncbi:hypothetical protein RFI_18277 [Reticulomyxa filosa]|uniref:Uncharacterized protein n=1 Tax=Reticulomyxa filosa TaxID=46433 RepID=X6MZA2_RETFI|nr:hypothetical protein RFI_18277 [Reticulomyxa filosa]|eukprot:ETO18963.1 hypothetical protein RFI_18277 [Reticulomyxa filosa]
MSSATLDLEEFVRRTQETETALVGLRHTLTEGTSKPNDNISAKQREHIREELLKIMEEVQKDQATIARQQQVIDELKESSKFAKQGLQQVAYNNFRKSKKKMDNCSKFGVVLLSIDLIYFKLLGIIFSYFVGFFLSSAQLHSSFTRARQRIFAVIELNNSLQKNIIDHYQKVQR